MTKFDNAYERALKRAEKAKQAFDNLPELNDQEKELCLQYMIENDWDHKLKAIASYRTNNKTDLRTAKDKVEAYIRAHSDSM